MFFIVIAFNSNLRVNILPLVQKSVCVFIRRVFNMHIKAFVFECKRKKNAKMIITKYGKVITQKLAIERYYHLNTLTHLNTLVNVLCFPQSKRWQWNGRGFFFWINGLFFQLCFFFLNTYFFFEYFSTFLLADAKVRRSKYIVFNGIKSDFPNQFENGETMHLFGISLYLNKFFFLPISSSLQ